MSIYAIGDVQGCYISLLRLLDKINFDPEADTLWFAGDLVNRGPHSLQTLRFVKSLGKSAVTVLGNHDLHLIALANNHPLFARKKTNLQDILTAPDAQDLINWLRCQKIMHSELGYHLVHAGVYPFWSIEFAQKQARELEKTLASDNYTDFIMYMYGNKPSIWRENLDSIHKLRFTANSFTRMRFLSADGRLNFTKNGDVGSTRLRPWFDFKPNRKIIFGHWSALSKIKQHNCYAIDTGCVWGKKLTAYKLGGKTKQVKC